MFFYDNCSWFNIGYNVIFLKIFNMLLAVTFHTTLLSRFLTKKFDLNIDTAKTFFASNLTLYIDKFHLHFHTESIFNRSVPVSSDVFIMMIFEVIPNGYIISQSYVVAALQLEESEYISDWISRTSHIMNDAIVPEYRTYVFPKKCSYVDQIRHFFRFYYRTKSEILLKDWIKRSSRAFQFWKNSKATPWKCCWYLSYWAFFSLKSVSTKSKRVRRFFLALLKNV